MTLQGPNLALLGASGQGYFPPGMVYGVKLRPVTCDPSSIDPEQLRIGTLVEMEHTKDAAIARQIALHHLCETYPHPYYIKGTGVAHEKLLLHGALPTIPTWVKWMAAGGAVVGIYLLASKAMQSTAWGEQRYAQARERSLHGTTTCAALESEAMATQREISSAAMRHLFASNPADREAALARRQRAERKFKIISAKYRSKGC